MARLRGADGAGAPAARTLGEMSGDPRLAEADRAAAAGDPARARALLEQVLADTPDRADLWIKLAAMR